MNYDDPHDVGEAVHGLFPAIYRAAHYRTDPTTGLPPRMLAALQHLFLSGPLTVGEQAEHHGVSRSTMTELVDRLEERGLVSRMPDDRDRRRVFVWLTDLGFQTAERSLQVLDPDLVVTAVKHLSVGERRHLVLGMQALVRSLKGDPS
ncbi:MAG TPA: MarR family winged helix-turn-helix transcriptional regulator [Acidimicrobiales bacterium]|nr:MarR family winged helix-turn-helix transcriptional regulator [Acidimicrobiales bacterium]